MTAAGDPQAHAGYLSGSARLAGVMGWPVAHSLSPRLHGHWLRRHGIDGAYLPLAVAPDRLERALQALPALGFRGCNLTLPHKESALRLVDEVSARAERIGAINTVVVAAEGGRLVGDNTDGFGFLENLRAALPAFDPGRGEAVILGAGGAARAVAATLLDAGAPGLRILNRSPERGAALAATLGPRAQALDWTERENALKDAAVLVNTTALGMTGHEALDLKLGGLPADAMVTDIVYTPLETPLLAGARARGNPVVDGLGMLLHQARPGFAAWFGVEPAVDADLRETVLGGLTHA